MDPARRGSLGPENGVLAAGNDVESSGRSCSTPPGLGEYGGMMPLLRAVTSSVLVGQHRSHRCCWRRGSASLVGPKVESLEESGYTFGQSLPQHRVVAPQGL